LGGCGNAPCGGDLPFCRQGISCCIFGVTRQRNVSATEKEGGWRARPSTFLELGRASCCYR